MKKKIALLSSFFTVTMSCLLVASASCAQETNGDSVGVVHLVLTDTAKLMRSDNGEYWENISMPPLKSDADIPEVPFTLFRKDGKYIMGSSYAYGPDEGKGGVFTSIDGVKWERRAELEGRLEALRAIDTNQGTEYFAFTWISHPTNPFKSALKVYRTFDIDSQIWEAASFDNIPFAEAFADKIAFGRQSDGSFVYYMSAHKTTHHADGRVEGHYGAVYRSTNGIDWIEDKNVSFNSPLKSIAYGNGRFLAAGWIPLEEGNSSNNRIYKLSANADNVSSWKKTTDLDYYKAGVGGDYGLSKINNTFYLVTAGNVHSSKNGVNWTNSFNSGIYGSPVSFSYNEVSADDLKDCSLQKNPKGTFLLGTHSSYLLSSEDGKNWSPVNNFFMDGTFHRVQGAVSVYRCIKNAPVIGKKAVATSPSQQENGLISYWWTDGGYSEWSEKDKRFVKHFVNHGNWFKERNWPQGKRVAAIYPNPSNSNLTIYWWTDGSYSDWDNTEKRFVTHAADQGVWFDSRGWPSGKKLAAISAHPESQKHLKRVYWWTDGTYSEWDTLWGRFDHHENGMAKPIKNWPKGKRIIAITSETRESDPNTWWNNSEVIYRWSDGSHSVYSKFHKAFTRHMNNQGDWFNQRGWPKK